MNFHVNLAACLLLCRLEKYREARLNEMFPDEIDTPMDTPARKRFERLVIGVHPSEAEFEVISIEIHINMQLSDPKK